MADAIVIGAGAIGGFLAARLHRAGVETVLVARGTRLELLRREGVVLAIEGVDETTRVPVAADCAACGAAKLVLLATKMADLAAALALAAPAVGPETAFLTLQNGVEAHLEVAAAFPGNPVFASRVHGFFEADGNRVRHVGVPPSVLYGQTAGPVGDDPVGELLARAGVTAIRSPKIEAELWEKLMLAAGAGGVGLALGKGVGKLSDDPADWAMAEAAMAEIASVAQARGVPLAPDSLSRMIAFAAAFPADVTTSLQRDVEAGRPSEYDALVGAVLRLGAAVGVATPVFARIDALARARGLV